MANEASGKRIYRIPEAWVEQRKESARVVQWVLSVVIFVVMLAVAVSQDWFSSEAHRGYWRTELIRAFILIGVVGGLLAGQWSLRLMVGRLRGYRVELTRDTIRRHMSLAETLILRREVASVRETRRRGIVITDVFGRTIVIPPAVEKYDELRTELHDWIPFSASVKLDA
jgi:hypothetical protein